MVAEKKYSKEIVRTFILWLMGAVGVGALLLFPDKLYFEAIVYTIMLMIVLTFIFNFKQISKYATYKPKRKAYQKLFGVGDSPIRGIFLGVLFGIAFLVLTKVKIFGAITLGMAVPSLPLALSGQSWVVIYLAPIIETAFFGIFLFSALSLFFPLWVAILIRASTFASFHYFAYVLVGGSTVSSIIGAFLGAFIFGIVGSLLAVYIGSEADASAHAFFNGWNFNEIYHIFSVI